MQIGREEQRERDRGGEERTRDSTAVLLLRVAGAVPRAPPPFIAVKPWISKMGSVSK